MLPEYAPALHTIVVVSVERECKEILLPERVPYKPKSFRDFLERHDIIGASIQRRDLLLSVEELRKKIPAS